ncbi:MAG: transposase, partial [Eubacterium sp.]|nr:transposase [Eubacterium sp.]
MKNSLIHYRTSVCNINYHVVWSVKYRRKILTADVEALLFTVNSKSILKSTS